MKKTRIFSMLLIILLAMACLAACGQGPAAEPEQETTPTEEIVPKEGDAIEATDYSDLNNWLSVPDQAKPVDVFVLYPTAYMPGEDDPIVAPIDDATMRSGARDFFVDSASAFETAGNMFAPFYRQLDATWVLTQTPAERDLYTSGVPKTDVLAAFDYYIQHYNDGRPFILAAHSQGSTVAKEILFDYLKDHPDVNERLVAAYIIGYSVTEQELADNAHLRFAEGPDDTGVIISYNTVSSAFEGELSTALPGAVAINPISWVRDETTAPASANLGSYVDRGNGYEQVMELADATVDLERGLVLCSTADVATYGMPEMMAEIFSRDSFHGQDISFYYYNLRQNAENRVAKYLENIR